MTRYYGFHSNKSRGLRLKNEEKGIESSIEKGQNKDIEIIDVSRYQPKKVPSLKWRERVKKIWKDDPLICPECLSEMKIISFITEGIIIKKVLKYLDLWDEERGSQLRTSRDLPVMPDIPSEIVYVPVDDGWSQPGSDLLS